MDSEVQKVIKETIVNLHKKGIVATPNEYKKEFCKISKEYNLTVQECELFKELVEKLSREEQIEIKRNNINSFEDLIPLLLNRVSKDSIDNLAELFQQSIKTIY